MKIYVVRHGQTDLNKNKVFSGRADVPLNQQGIEESKLLADNLPPGIDKIYCSPLLRTQQTAEIINQKLHVPIEVRDELIERDAGSMTGKPHAGNEHLRQYNSDLRPYGGEWYEDSRSRVEKMFSYLK